jgi:hypothetical protein
MPDQCESTSLTEHLRLRLVNGEGKVVYDSQSDKPEMGYPDEPLEFCPKCGTKIQPVVYMCTKSTCGTRFVQTQDKKSGKLLLMTMPKDTEPKTP